MPKRCSAPTPRTSSAKSEYNIQPPGTENVPGGSDCRQSSESFRPPFSKGGAVEGAKPSSPSADGEILLSALSFCKAFSLRLHGQRKSVVQIRSFFVANAFVCSLSRPARETCRAAFFSSGRLPELLSFLFCAARTGLPQAAQPGEAGRNQPRFCILFPASVPDR